MILTPEQARRKTVAACQAALTKRGVAVLVVPVHVANALAERLLLALAALGVPTEARPNGPTAARIAPQGVA